MSTQKDLQNIQVRPDSFECSITADITVFGYVDNKLKVLLLKKTVGDFKNHWMVPGGVMETHETVEDCAAKVLFALTGFKDIHFEQVKTYSSLDRHPLKRVITVCFYALVKPENHPLTLRSDVQQIHWFDVDELPDQLGFDHEQLIKDAYLFVQTNLRDRLVVGELLPKQFTLPELQNLYEHILNVKLDKRNFRKKMFQMDILQNTGQKKVGIKGGPLLYEVKKA
ncbi:NUDIX hydrolase [Flagellimonas algicola]|uniref:NUDIX hydrolase n=1 Tax=Flagellimonas algicola TaxID=2583815 RepID=A0ABY2WJI1_9FLAO|nr:NUDIX domain-containing protein [Allomuricauda algicola]TMU54797.1 NUDIX hydrolase [Allomuricauda algicola]